MIPKAAVCRHVVPLFPIPTGLERRGALPAPPRAVLFDVYGTLLISGAGEIGTAGRTVPDPDKLALLMAEYGLPHTPEALLTAFADAIAGEHAAKRGEGVDCPEVDIETIWRKVLAGVDKASVRQFAAEFEMVQNPVFPMPRLAEILSGLKSRSVRMGIVSNAQFYTPLLFEWFLDRDLEGLGFDPRLLFFSYRLGRAKPSLYPFEKAAAALLALGMSPPDVLYVGNDMRNDIRPAAAVGFKTALFAGDRRSLRLRETDPAQGVPDLVVTDLVQLLDLFDPTP